MADYSCEWCDKVDRCKYSYVETDCIPQRQIDLASKVSRLEINRFEKIISELKTRDEDLFHGVIRGYECIVNEYPTYEELQYAQSLLSDTKEVKDDYFCTHCGKTATDREYCSTCGECECMCQCEGV